MNNEPVAWMNKSDDETVFIKNTGNTKVIGGNPIPLYTHPAKTLTHEEQFKADYMANFLSSYMAVRYDSDCANGHPLKGYQPVEDAQFLANEAWAILRKANEK